MNSKGRKSLEGPLPKQFNCCLGDASKTQVEISIQIRTSKTTPKLGVKERPYQTSHVLEGHASLVKGNSKHGGKETSHQTSNMVEWLASFVSRIAETVTYKVQNPRCRSAQKPWCESILRLDMKRQFVNSQLRKENP